MAFNPFHRFRKHQKAFFAILTIICMFVFVLQIGFGRADPLTRMMDFFGAGKHRGELVTTLNGVKIYRSDLEKLERHRQIADMFVRGVLEQATQEAWQEAMTQERAAKPESKDNSVTSAMQSFQQRRFADQSPQFAEMLGLDSPVARLGSIRRSIMELSNAKKDKPAMELLYDRLIAALNFEYWQTKQAQPRTSFYFGGSKDPEDLLDFIMWKQKGDQLGIVLNAADMVKALNLEASRPDFLAPGNLLGEAKARGMRIDYRDLTETELERSLIDEFRVAMVQEALLGEPGATRGLTPPDDNVNQSPATFSSLEFLQFFRENRTTLNVALLNVPVSQFVSKVTGAPSEKDLSRIFERYKEQEPAPERDEPGFKEPREVRVEYVTSRADAPFYQTLARNRILFPTVARVGAFANAYAAGGGVAWAAAAVSLPPWTRDPVTREYDIYKENVATWLHPLRGNSVHDTSFLRPQNFAALVAQVGGALSGAPLWTATTTMEGSAFGYEMRDRLRAIPGSVLAGAAMFSNPLGATALAVPYTPAILPLRSLQTQMMDVALHTEPTSLLHENLMIMATKIRELSTKPEEARRYVEQAVKDYGLDCKKMSHLKDQYAIANDPELKVLKDAYAEKGLRQRKESFVQALFLGKGVYESMLFSEESGLVTKSDQQADWTNSKEPFVLWRFQDKAARVRTFAEAESDVKAAWRRQEAQRLARAEAERIEAAVRKRNSPVDVLAFLREQKPFRVEELPNVSLLVQGIAPGQYQDYRPPADVVAYPRSNFVQTLLTMKNRGDSVVLRDRPEANYYVAALLERSEPKIDGEFIEVYEKTPLRDSMMQQMFLAQRRRQFRTRLVEQLRAEAGPVEGGRFKIPEKFSLQRSDTSEEG